MSQRTVTALREFQRASSKAYDAKSNAKVGVEEFKALQKSAQLRKSIYEGLQRIEPITAEDWKNEPKRPETVEQLRNRRRGEALIAGRLNQQRAYRDSLHARTGDPIYLNPLFETR